MFVEKINRINIILLGNKWYKWKMLQITKKYSNFILNSYSCKFIIIIKNYFIKFWRCFLHKRLFQYFIYNLFFNEKRKPFINDIQNKYLQKEIYVKRNMQYIFIQIEKKIKAIYVSPMQNVFVTVSTILCKIT